MPEQPIFFAEDAAMPIASEASTPLHGFRGQDRATPTLPSAPPG